jgi:hypothetical protein
MVGFEPDVAERSDRRHVGVGSDSVYITIATHSDYRYVTPRESNLQKQEPSLVEFLFFLSRSDWWFSTYFRVINVTHLAESRIVKE